jgi:hypothetical protein
VLRNLAAEIWPNNPPVTPRSTRILNNVASAAKKALRLVRHYAAKERAKFLNELKARLASQMSPATTDVDAAIQNMDRQLVDGRRFRRISRALKPTVNVTLTKGVIVITASHIHPTTGETVNQRTVKIVDTHKALEDAIIERNRRHFAQADGTPFTKDPLSQIGSTNDYNVSADANGNNITPPEDSFVETKAVMALLQEKQQDPGLLWSVMVSFDEFIAGFLHWRESTSTSPSGRHLGVY